MSVLWKMVLCTRYTSREISRAPNNCRPECDKCNLHSIQFGRGTVNGNRMRDRRNMQRKRQICYRAKHTRYIIMKIVVKEIFLFLEETRGESLPVIIFNDIREICDSISFYFSLSQVYNPLSRYPITYTQFSEITQSF